MLLCHGYAQSINVRKVLWLAAEIGEDVQLIGRGTPDAPASDPTFLALNPFGHVPLVEDGEFRVAESNSILRYLCRKHGRTDLLPTTAHEAAAVEMWIDWQATDFNESWRYVFSARVRQNPEFDDPIEIARSERVLSEKVKIVEAQLRTTRRYVAGEVFTLADIVIGLSLRRWLAIPYAKPQLPCIQAYYERLCDETRFASFGGPDSPP